jgi:predicted restriction endonuclease
MKVEEFKNWLIFQKKYDKRTVGSRMSGCKRLERHHIDLEAEFYKDKGKNLLSILTYSKKEEDNNINPKHTIQINGDVYEGTATLKRAAKLYFIFCHSLDRQVIPTEKLKEDIAVIENNKTYSEEEKRVLIKYRLGQSEYRKKLIDYWEGCSVTGCSYIDALIASHIKPWSESENHEKYDLFNGLLLTPNYDKLFDRHLISFEDDGKIKISNKLKDEDLKLLSISKSAQLKEEKMTVEHATYLKKHREKLSKWLN